MNPYITIFNSYMKFKFPDHRMFFCDTEDKFIIDEKEMNKCFLYLQLYDVRIVDRKSLVIYEYIKKYFSNNYDLVDFINWLDTDFYLKNFVYHVATTTDFGYQIMIHILDYRAEHKKFRSSIEYEAEDIRESFNILSQELYL